MSLLALLNGAQIANGQVIDADDLKDNFNQLINLLNGTSNDKEALIKRSSATDAPLTLNQQNAAGHVQSWQLNAVEKLKVNNLAQLESLLATGTAPFIVASTTKVSNLNADLLDGLDSAAFALLATHRTWHNTTIGFESDPNITTLTNEDRPVWVAPPNANEMKITRLWVKFTSGSHTAGGNLQYTIRKRNAAGGASADIGVVTLDNTNNTIHVVYFTDIADFTLTAGDTITFYKSTLAGTITERSVSIGFEWYQKLST